MFPIETADSSRAISHEQLGTKKKFWYEDERGALKLFKAEERGLGEDWAEKVVCELARLLGIPHLSYDMARDAVTNDPGVICPFMLREGQALVHGNELLQKFDAKYPKSKPRANAHTIDAVFRIVRVLLDPELKWNQDVPRGFMRGAPVFCGYLMLDAFVGNQDRHHENWAAIWDGHAPRGLQVRLAPSYDHGSSLARNVSDEEKEARLRTRDAGFSVAAFARKARSKLFTSPTDTRPLGTHDAFWAFARLVPEARQIWLERLRLLDEASILEILAQVPPDRLSAVGRDFTLQLLRENRNRLLETHENEE